MKAKLLHTEEVAKVLGRAPRTHKPMDISNPFHI